MIPHSGLRAPVLSTPIRAEQGDRNARSGSSPRSRSRPPTEVNPLVRFPERVDSISCCENRGLSIEKDGTQRAA